MSVICFAGLENASKLWIQQGYMFVSLLLCASVVKS